MPTMALKGCKDKPRPGKQPIYTKATDKRILKLLDKPPPAGFARWTGPLLAEELGDVDVQYVWRFLRSHKIDLVARKSWCESNDPQLYGQSRRCCWPLCRPAREGHRAMRGRKAFDPGFGASAGLSEAAQRPRPDRSKPRLQAARHDNAVCGAGSRHRKDHRDAFKTTSPRRVSRLHGSASPQLFRTASFTSSSTTSTPTRRTRNGSRPIPM